ncbi:hypothetical protein ASPTUDRAFT_926269 [Aspergillus tubingensis CBS 134.48]|uniref:Uncharacterized protein n=1 Tax=Aspergillus tubingensis (strain CBS 134.48) TaxID=767770 RepID=A0A1L9N7M4_ASPTC|nr:hypothetical protein ASPTUDRAFT_926269 [Aspergillus tubingensis CBS 134.48]
MNAEASNSWIKGINKRSFDVEIYITGYHSKCGVYKWSTGVCMAAVSLFPSKYDEKDILVADYWCTSLGYLTLDQGPDQHTGRRSSSSPAGARADMHLSGGVILPVRNHYEWRNTGSVATPEDVLSFLQALAYLLRNMVRVHIFCGKTIIVPTHIPQPGRSGYSRLDTDITELQISGSPQSLSAGPSVQLIAGLPLNLSVF